MQDAHTLWNFLTQGRCSRAPCDMIIVCGSYDLTVCDYACQLYFNGIAPKILMTGDTGNWTKFLWSEAEAAIFKNHACELGVDPCVIYTETQATNFSENIRFSKALFPDIRSATFVTKPNSILRVALTLPIQWPELNAYIDAPPYQFPQDISPIIGVLGVIDEMVGDIHRILCYPDKGFQIPCVIPDQVLGAWDRLVQQGFNRHLVT